MKELMQAIYTRYNTSTTFKGLLATGAFYYGRGKQDGALPYCVYTSGETINEDTFKKTISEVTIQMNLYTESDTTSSTCFDLLEACRLLFEDQVLTVTDYYDVLLTKIMEIPPMNIDGIKWMAVIEFNCLLQKK